MRTATDPLEGIHDLDHAVARGAAYYGWAKHQGGVRIRGGVARSYYVGIETAGLAIPGAPRPLRALCVVPFGMEEGTECDVPSAEVGLVVGEPMQFRFFSSAVRKDDQPGDVLDRVGRRRTGRNRFRWRRRCPPMRMSKTRTCRFVPVAHHRTGHVRAVVRGEPPRRADGNWNSACAKSGVLINGGQGQHRRR